MSDCRYQRHISYFRSGKKAKVNFTVTSPCFLAAFQHHHSGTDGEVVTIFHICSDSDLGSGPHGECFMHVESKPKQDGGQVSFETKENVP